MPGADLHFEDRGAGPALVLLHGFPMDCRIWADPLENLAKIARVIVPDLPGFGRSTSAEPFTIESLADDIYSLLTHLNALPCILGGLSMGGYVTLAFAKKYASALKGLILFDTRSEADSPQARESRAEMIAKVRSEGTPAIAKIMLPRLLAADARNEVVHELNSIMLDCPPLTIQHALEAMRDREDYTDKLSQIDVPTLVIVGERDAISPPPVAEAMCQKIRHGKLVVIPGAGHVTPMEQAPLVADAITEFIGSI